METEELGPRQRRIERRSGYLTRKDDPHNITMDDLQNPWTLASLFMRPTKEWLDWLMDEELLRREVTCGHAQCSSKPCKLQVSVLSFAIIVYTNG